MRLTALLLPALLGCLVHCAAPPPARAPTPPWVDVPGAHPKAPTGSHLSAVGRGARASSDPREAARASALAQIAQSIQVQVLSQVELESRSRLENGESSYEEELREAVRLVAAEELPGATAVETWTDPATGEVFTLMAVPRDLMARRDLDEVSARLDAADAALAAVHAVEDESPSRALVHQVEAFEALSLAQVHATRARIVALDSPRQRQAQEHWERVMSRRREVEAGLTDRLARLRLVKLSGDDQSAHVGGSLATSLAARLEFVSADGRIAPAAGLPVRFALADASRAELAPSALVTDANGAVQCAVSDLRNTGRAANVITLLADLTSIAPSLPARFVPSVAFQYRLPTPGQTRILLDVQMVYEGAVVDDARIQTLVAEHLSRKGFTVQTARPTQIAPSTALRDLSIPELRSRLGGAFDYVLLGRATAQRGDRMGRLQMFRMQAEIDVVPLADDRTRKLATDPLTGGGSDDTPASAAKALVQAAGKPLLERLDAAFVADFVPDTAAP